MTAETVRIRPGNAADTAAVLALLDDAVRWLAGRGRTGQWGTLPFSDQPRRIDQVLGFTGGGGLRIAEIGGTVAGAVALGPAPQYVPPASAPELYVQLLVTDRGYRGHGIGGLLLNHARLEAVRQGAHLLRLDCWAGGDQALVRYYERAGFTRGERFTVGDWQGQILWRRCVPEDPG